jgi:steroid 5-alpha reductase family enzyme
MHALSLFSSIFVQSAAVIFVFMTCAFGISRWMRKISIVDCCCWGLGFVVLSWYLLIMHGDMCSRQILMIILITVWGLRLTAHIFMRSCGKPEDIRYAKLIETWHLNRDLQIYIKIFLVQGFFMFLIAVPIMLIVRDCTKELTMLDYVGVVVWVVGFLFESISDYQLQHFLQRPENKGKIMRAGLWAYTRHPNYFGEVVMWWGIFLIALNSQYGIFALVSPLAISWLLYVSCIPKLEKHLESNPEFQAYKRSTSAFFPWRFGK